MASSIGSVTRVDYAHGVSVTYERLDPTAEGYGPDQRWWYAVWTGPGEIEESGYTATKGEAKEYADICRYSLNFSRES